MATAATYTDRQTGEVFIHARAMVDDYLRQFFEKNAMERVRLDETGYAGFRRGSAEVAVHVLDDHGVLLVLAPVLAVPSSRREEFYRRLLELSFVTTSDAAFAIDSAKEEVSVRALRRLSGLDYEEFEDLLETVGRVADDWDDVLKREFP